MTTSKKQVASVGKPKDKIAVVGTKNGRATAISEKKTTANDSRKAEAKPRLFASRRVWPD